MVVLDILVVVHAAARVSFAAVLVMGVGRRHAFDNLDRRNGHVKWERMDRIF